MRFIIFLSGKFFAGTVVRNYFSTSKLGMKEDTTDNTQYARKRARFSELLSAAACGSREVSSGAQFLLQEQ